MLHSDCGVREANLSSICGVTRPRANGPYQGDAVIALRHVLKHYVTMLPRQVNLTGLDNLDKLCLQILIINMRFRSYVLLVPHGLRFSMPDLQNMVEFRLVYGEVAEPQKDRVGGIRCPPVLSNISFRVRA